ncbi:cell cycle progression protein 1 isoform X2 [Trichomycterus rosablanca]|uniref:cell cycle progression protein 1 isoform X2 n=1 Tax=Trichomycterus rosablanca TaxID=2290929 RepID=UPI002F357074
MSDNSTGSSESSNNSWTLLSPEEAAIDTAGTVDDGTESIGDAPSLSEEVAGSSLDVRLNETEPSSEIIFSEEGQQVCQETSPEFFEEGAATGFVETDPEICAPVIHDTITSSPPDNDLLGAVPFSIATESALFLSEEASLEKHYEEMFPDVQEPLKPSPVPEAEDKVTPAPEPKTEINPCPEPKAEITPSDESLGETTDSPATPGSLFSNVPASGSIVLDSYNRISAVAVIDIHAEVIASPEIQSQPEPSEFASGADSADRKVTGFHVLEEQESTIEREASELAAKGVDVVREAESIGADWPIEHPEESSRLRLRHAQHAQEQRESSDDEEREEVEFRVPERKEEKSGFSLNHLIIGALALLCLGSLFLSDDHDGSELSDQELLERLAQENKQISILEAQLQSQKEELDQALRTAAKKGITDKENTKLKEELSAMPGLKEELEALKARIAELTQLTAEEPSGPLSSSTPSPASPPDVPKDSQGPAKPEKQWNKKEELKRQKSLLEESKKRLEGMKKQGWSKKGLRERLVEVQQRLSDQVDHLDKQYEWKRKHNEGKKRKNEREEKRSSKDMDTRKGWKVGKDKHGQKHKEHLKQYHEEWERSKIERKQEREKRKQERSWQTKPGHQHPQDKHHVSVDFWKHQEKKLRRNLNPPEHCNDVAGCAEAEGLVPVKFSQFQSLLQMYLSKLEGLTEENKEALQHLVTQFFSDGIFSHHTMLFSEFAEDVADILEDLADILKDDDVLEEKMEEFEREALVKFAA